MARPIQNTPIIKGEDAERFRNNLRNILLQKLSSQEKAAKQKHLKDMEKKYDLIVASSNGVFF